MLLKKSRDGLFILAGILLFLVSLLSVSAYPTEYSWYHANTDYIDEGASGNDLSSSGISISDTQTKVLNASYKANGNTNYASSTTYAIYPLGNDAFSLCYWVYLTESVAGGDDWVVMSFGTGGGSHSIAMGYENGNIAFMGNMNNAYIGFSQDMYNWQHDCITYSPSNHTAEAWINGASVGVGALSGNLNIQGGGYLYLNKWPMNGAHGISGYLSDVRLYSWTLDSDMISDIYNSGAGTSTSLSAFSAPVPKNVTFDNSTPSNGAHLTLTDSFMVGVVSNFNATWCDFIPNGTIGDNLTQGIDEMHYSGFYSLPNGTYDYVVSCTPDTGGLPVSTPNRTLSISYTIPCSESWQEVEGSCVNNIKGVHYVDSNSCGTFENLPGANGSAIPCTNSSTIVLTLDPKVWIVILFIILIFGSLYLSGRFPDYPLTYALVGVFIAAFALYIRFAIFKDALGIDAMPANIFELVLFILAIALLFVGVTEQFKKMG